MALQDLVRDLSRPGAWPEAGPVEVRQTHISVVFLVGDRAYKVKKPLALGFLDYSTLALRERFCAEEIRLNQRFSPDVYLGLVPIGSRDGRFVPGATPAVEWAVAMRRLPEEATLLAHVEAGTVDRAMVEAAGRRIAAFHAHAEGGPKVSEGARFDTVARNARENFDQTAAHVGLTVERPVWERVRALTEEALERLRDRIEARSGLARDTHGDLRLEHVYVLGPGDEGIRFLDCIEFSERFRYADPVADVAFLVMDLAVRGERALADALADAWFAASGDRDGRDLMPFYVAYRSVVRAKVAGLQALDPATSPARRNLTLARARRHWLFALATLERPERRPCLLGVGGLPGTGKSTLAHDLAETAGFAVVRADTVRKELAGMDPNDHLAGAYGKGLYAPGRKDRVYTACLDRARDVIAAGGRAIVDASFSAERWRAQLLAEARSLGVQGRFLWCEAPPAVVRSRLASRGPDPSDADWTVYLAAAERWEAPGALVSAVSDPIDTGPALEATTTAAMGALAAAGLAGS